MDTMDVDSEDGFEIVAATEESSGASLSDSIDLDDVQKQEASMAVYGHVLTLGMADCTSDANHV
jgi:hypothetical protein